MPQAEHPYSFKRSEHLKKRKAIGMVFEQSRDLRATPIRLLYAIERADAFSYQVAFVAPKKIHHFAVDRNRNKRLLREAFRLNRSLLTGALADCPVKLMFMFIAQNSSEMTFAQVEERVKQLLTRLAEKVKKEVR